MDRPPLWDPESGRFCPFQELSRLHGFVMKPWLVSREICQRRKHELAERQWATSLDNTFDLAHNVPASNGLYHRLCGRAAHATLVANQLTIAVYAGV